MTEIGRRSFLKSALSGVAGASLLARTSAAPAADAQRKLVIGVIGCGGQAASLIKAFAGYESVIVTHVCDPDSDRANKGASIVHEVTGASPKVVEDMRRILDDRDIDAVVIATPDYWHAPATILACEAGKHVYVEKPCSHNLREGRLMVEAARRNRRCVQVGTQGRGLPHVIRAIQLLREGAIGTVLSAKAFTSQLRGSIGHKTPQDPPANLNYDLWLGPIPHVPFQSNRYHYTWRWWYDFGTGDIGNDGVHELDIARWGLGVQSHPSTITGAGTKLFFDDDQQFPDTYHVVFEYPGDGKVGSRRELVFELRNWSPYGQDGYENGNAYYGTKGMMLLGKEAGWRLFGPKGELRDQMESNSFDSGPHHRSFLAAVRDGEPLNADIETGHLSSSLAHLGNIAVRVGRVLRFDPVHERILDDEQANGLLRRAYRDGHWAVPKDV